MFALILAAATELIRQHGFDSLTMKSLARASGMSVGKLYQSFASKDDLFLHLEIAYFDTLYQRIVAVREAVALQGGGCRKQFMAVIEDYFDFAVTRVDLYKLVTSPPKVFSDYRGSRLEALAQRELEAALRTIDLFRQVFTAASRERHGVRPEADEQARFLSFVNSVHGLILMSQSPVWPYLVGDTQVLSFPAEASSRPGNTTLAVSPSEPPQAASAGTRDALVRQQLDLLVETLI